MQISGIRNYQQNRQYGQQRTSFTAIKLSAENCKPIVKDILDYFEKKGMLANGVTKEDKKVHIITTKFHSSEERSTFAELISDAQDLEMLPTQAALRDVIRFNKSH